MPIATPLLRRAAWLEIDLDALRNNVTVIRGLAGDHVAVAPVVKADAYGHGLAAVGPALADVSDALCVATLDEALALRARGVRGRIIVLYPVPAGGVADAVEAAVELTIMSAQDLDNVRARSTPDAPAALVHLAVETGMSRGGLVLEAVAETAAQLRVEPGCKLRGIWSHLASAADAAKAAVQVERFDRTIETMRARHEPVPPRHLAATDAIFAATAPMLELVRPGLAVYGVLEASLPLAAHARRAALDLAPAMVLKARAVAFSDVPVGGTVGYGGQWRATCPSRVAILPLGYGDGYSRAMQPGAEALLRGRRVALVGVISMDAVAVDVTGCGDVGHEEEFVLLGAQGEQSISAGELARWRNTITWETLSSMAPRLERVYNRSAGTAPSD